MDGVSEWVSEWVSEKPSPREAIASKKNCTYFKIYFFHISAIHLVILKSIVISIIASWMSDEESSVVD